MRAARRAWRRLEPVHAMIYFVSEAPERYAALGLDPQTGYFASRAAASGAPPPRSSSRRSTTSTPTSSAPPSRRPGRRRRRNSCSPPARTRPAPHSAAPRIDQLPGLEETVSWPAGPPRPPPTTPRGGPSTPRTRPCPGRTSRSSSSGGRRPSSANSAATATSPSSPPGASPPSRRSCCTRPPAPCPRGSSPRPGLLVADQWDATAERLRARVPAGRRIPHPEGEAFRQSIEDRTDELALPAYAALGEDDCERLADLARPSAGPS